MYGSVVRSALLLPASVLAPPLGTLGLDHVSPNEVGRNKRPFGPPAALKGFIAKRSFGAWLPSSPVASVLP